MILIGEIRDLETAETAIQASLTGHLVFSTLHTNDAPSAFTRLIDMGVEPFLVASTVEGVMAQRLVRTICPDCKTTYEPGRRTSCRSTSRSARRRRSRPRTWSTAEVIADRSVRRPTRSCGRAPAAGRAARPATAAGPASTS